MEKMEDAKYLDLIAKYLSGNIVPPEREELFAWVERDEVNQKFFDEMIQLWGISSEYEEEPFTADVAAAWNLMDARLSEAAKAEQERPEEKSGKIIRLSNRFGWLRIAAVILLLVTAGLALWFDPLGLRLREIRTGAFALERPVTLPDGSQVWLNKHSRLSYRWPFRQREVTMIGEAFFEVESDSLHPFSIFSEEARTTVLGTSFNVRAYPGDEHIEVAVREGTVRLEDRREPAEKVVLKKGRTGILDRKEQEVREVEQNSVNADAWKTRTLDFNDLALGDAIPAIERFYGVTIRYENPGILNCEVVGTYPDVKLEDLLAIIYRMLHNDVEIEAVNDSTYIFRGKGCPE